MSAPDPRPFEVAVLDIDGTLLDSTYHHSLAWARALARLDVVVPVRSVHRLIGMGGDRLVAEVAGQEVEARVGDRARELWQHEYDALIGETHLLPGARELLAGLHARGLQVVLASSGVPDHTAYATELLDAGRWVSATTTAEDVEASKPDPEVLDTVLAEVGGGSAFVVGDAVWDVEAASRRDLPAIGLRSGGTCGAELLDAGAVAVYDDPAHLLEHLDDALHRVSPG